MIKIQNCGTIDWAVINSMWESAPVDGECRSAVGIPLGKKLGLPFVEVRYDRDGR